MPYGSGETPMVADRISDEKGRLGTVTGVHSSGVFTVRWDDGVVGINYSVAERFTLVFRAPEQE